MAYVYVALDKELATSRTLKKQFTKKAGRVAVCCSVVQCVAVRCRLLRCVAVV